MVTVPKKGMELNLTIKIQRMEWYEISNIDDIDTPALVLYRERIHHNIHKAIALTGDPARLRPHVKTNKIAEVCAMMMKAGVTKFKCATIAEAEMLGMIGANDVLLAYQPVGPKAKRLLALVQKYRQTNYSCLLDDGNVATALDKLFSKAGLVLPVFIDVNTGMNRTGIDPEKAITLLDVLLSLHGLYLKGIHAYDGHITSADAASRNVEVARASERLQQLLITFRSKFNRDPILITGGSPTFPEHRRADVECSPGTFVFWDDGYATLYPGEPFQFAALVITRVISIVNENTITTDLGYKSVASEKPLPRVRFLNAPDAVPKSQSEEHLTIEVPDSSSYGIGDALFGVPVHICPTVALYEKAFVVEHNSVTDSWNVLARDRILSI